MKIILKILAGLIFSVTIALAGESAQVEMFSPQGSVKGVRQVSARFSKSMVPFGDPRLEDPFSIDCAEKGQGRWVDGKTWSYDFEKDLAAGLVCTFQVKPNVKSLANEPIGGQRTFSFNTGGPSVKNSRPEDGQNSIDESQVFIFSLEAEADEDSVLKNVYFSIQGIQERVGLKLIKGPEKNQLLKTIKYKEEKTPTLVFQCKQTFPADSKVKIIWGKGVRSVSGVSNTEDQVLAFKTRKPFYAVFLGKREKPKAGCIPLLPMKLNFSAPVAWETAKQIQLKSQSGRSWKPKAKGEDSKDYVDGIVFEGPFPENQSFTLHLPKNVRDDSGRALTNQNKFPLLIKTDRYPSLAKFASRFGMIELNEGALLPLTIRNLENEIKALMTGTLEERPGKTKPKILEGALKSEGSIKPGPLPSIEKGSPEIGRNIKGKFHQIPLAKEEKIIEWLSRVRTAKRTVPLLKDKDAIQKLSIPKTGGSEEFEVIGIPLKGPGFYVVELESEILGSRLLAKPSPMYVQTAALVTNLSAHFKWGRESSLVWVTTLDEGEPVPAASVTIRDCAGKKIWEGKTNESGIARIDKALPSNSDIHRCSEKQEEEDYSPALSGIRGGLFVFAQKADDLTFIHSSWNQGIESWRFNIPGGLDADNPNLLTHTVFDRTLFRAGEEVHMKHFFRKRSMKGLFIPPEKGEFKEGVIEQVGSNQQYFFPLKWRDNGTAETAFTLPAQAKLGTYEVYFLNKSKGAKSQGDQKILSGSFRVEEFRIPMMKAIIQGPKEPVIHTQEFEVDLLVSYLSGGGAAHLPVKLRTDLQPKSISFPDHENIIFSNGRVKPGIQKSKSYEDEYNEEEEDDQGLKENKGDLQTRPLTLDKQGAARVKISGFPERDTPQNILAELEFRDPNGEIQTVTSRIPTYPSNVLAGITTGVREPSQNALLYQVVVVDLNGKPRPQVEVKTHLLQKKTYSHRRRLTGGFYAYENITEIKDRGPHCKGKTDQNGVLYCEGPSPVTGQIIIQAEVADERNNLSLANSELWIPGKDDQWGEVGSDDRIDLIPEKKTVETGETARFQVKMPFKEASVLITVEREGVMEAYVKKISRADPFFEIPVKEHYAPNVFVSALVVRGRIPKTQPTAMFDPGKPAYKLGLTEIQVGWKPHELKVEVLPDKTNYIPRETVTARIKVKTAYGKVPPKGSEVAVAVVDEGLLELKPNESWKLLEAMMKRKGCDVETSTAQMMVIGKRHFGRKALPHGGGGGRLPTRELFDALVYWKGVILLDETGQALIQFPLNDSLTSFRIVAVAAGGQDLFGTGGSSIRTTQDVITLSGIPPLVREGDQFLAGFTVRNASQKEMKIEAGLLVKELKGKKTFETIRETIQAGEAKAIGWEVSVPLGIEKMDYELDVKEIDGTAHDRLRVSQKVTKAVPVRTFQATLTQVKGPLRLEVEKPEEALPGQGGLTLLFKPRLFDGLGGLTEYMKNYPYLCLEQKISKVIALRDKESWKPLMAELPSYLDGDGLAKYFPNMRQGSDVLTAYLLAISQEAGTEIPEPLRDKMLKGLKVFIEGRVIRYSSIPTADLALRKLAAIEALSRYGQADQSLLSTLSIEPNLWPTSALLDWINTLSRVKDIPDRNKKMKEAEQILRSRLNLQGTTMGLSTESTDHLWWLMATPDTNAVKTLLTTLPLAGWQEDHPRMAKGLVGRMKRGHWDTTIANAWGMLALEKFGALYESIPVTGDTDLSINKKTESVDWKKTPGGKEIGFPWEEKKETLTIIHRGGGSPWVTVQCLAALPLKKSFSSGYRIKKTLIPVEQKSKGLWTKGDVVRVRLELEAQADMTWVVVNDPIPAGSMILGSGLGRDSSLLTKDELERGWAWETLRERSFEALRVYYEYVPKGKWSVEYTLRFNNEGLFYLPETRVEALYAPEMLGELPNPKMEIRR
ncbi:MAG: MG2 domain-containing protein [Thermodesulfobacteriota bacterium]